MNEMKLLKCRIILLNIPDGLNAAGLSCLQFANLLGNLNGGPQVSSSMERGQPVASLLATLGDQSASSAADNSGGLSYPPTGLTAKQQLQTDNSLAVESSLLRSFLLNAANSTSPAENKELALQHQLLLQAAAGSNAGQLDSNLLAMLMEIGQEGGTQMLQQLASGQVEGTQVPQLLEGGQLGEALLSQLLAEGQVRGVQLSQLLAAGQLGNTPQSQRPADGQVGEALAGGQTGVSQLSQLMAAGQVGGTQLSKLLAAGQVGGTQLSQLLSAGQAGGPQLSQLLAAGQAGGPQQSRYLAAGQAGGPQLSRYLTAGQVGGSQWSQILTAGKAGRSHLQQLLPAGQVDETKLSHPLALGQEGGTQLSQFLAGDQMGRTQLSQLWAANQAGGPQLSQYLAAGQAGDSQLSQPLAAGQTGGSQLLMGGKNEEGQLAQLLASYQPLSRSESNSIYLGKNFFLPFNMNIINEGNEEVLTFCCQRSGRTSARLLEALGGEDWKITFKRVALATIGGNFNDRRHGSAILMTRTAMRVVWACSCMRRT
jgi:hypothetical protein